MVAKKLTKEVCYRIERLVRYLKEQEKIILLTIMLKYQILFVLHLQSNLKNKGI